MNGEGDRRRIARRQKGPVDDMMHLFEGQPADHWQTLWAFTSHLLAHPRLSKRETAVIKERTGLEQQRALSKDPLIFLESRFRRIINTGRGFPPSTVEIAIELLRSLDYQIQKPSVVSAEGSVDAERVVAAVEITGQRAAQEAADILYAVGMSRRTRERATDTMPRLTIFRRLGGKDSAPQDMDYDEEVIRRVRFSVLGNDGLQVLATRTTLVSDSPFNNHPVSRDSVGIAFIIPGKTNTRDAPEVRVLH